MVIILVRKIKIVGLGPGGTEYLTVKALEELKKARKVYLRTEKHPIVDYIKDLGIKTSSFDNIYDATEKFEDVYDRIVDKLIEYSNKETTVYAVPGSPFVAENTVQKLIEISKTNSDISLEIIGGVSFIEAILNRIQIDPIKGLKVIDGLQMHGQTPDPEVDIIVTQVYNKLVASDVKLKLMDYYDDEYEIRVIRGAGIEGEEVVLKIPLYELDRIQFLDHLTSIFIPRDSNNTKKKYKMKDLVDIMEKLRSEEGCPWDREQTHESLKPYLIEECYEVLEALDSEDLELLEEELGDLLLQIVFHSQIAFEKDYFTIDDVITGICNKLIHRHPHVFGELSLDSSKRVLENWEEIKRKEKEEKSYTESLTRVPKNLPSLMKSYKIQSKAAKVGFDWDNVEGAMEKVKEEMDELLQVYKTEKYEEIEEEIGDLLFAVVNVARFLEVRPELALNKTVDKFIKRFNYIEIKSKELSIDLKDMTLKEMDNLWNEAKKIDKFNYFFKKSL